MTALEAIILGVVEGVTEFLPISSTGHLVLVTHFMKMEVTEFQKAFDVIIQFGAILSVLLIYWRKILARPDLIKWMIISFIPTAVIGFAAKDFVDRFLESSVIVAWALIIGGAALIWIDHWSEKQQSPRKTLSDLNMKDSLLLGLFQATALIPGVSRSGATIFTGMLLKFDKKEATEFSFLLALPTLAAAGLYKFLKIYKQIHSDQFSLLAIGLLVSFIVAWMAIKFFIHFVGRHGFKYFGYYRIALGALVLFFGS